MSKLASAFAVLLAAAPACAQAAGDNDHWDARLTAVSGDVVVYPARGGEEIDASPDMPLEEGDRVTTSAGSTAEIALDGGSLIALRENSDFTLENTKKSESIFSLSLGSILAKIQKLGSSSMSVRSPTSVAAVRGTEFAVDVEADQSHVGVFDEGRVEVKGQSGGVEVLAPNQETSVPRGRAPLRAAPLRRFAARREQMRAHVRRLEAVRRGWKRLRPAARRAARTRALQRRRRQNVKAREHRAQEIQRRRRQQQRRQTENEKREPGRER